VVPCLRRTHGGEDGGEGADIELEGPDELHRGRLPVDLMRQEHEDLAAGGARPPRRGVDRLAVLQEAGRGEEQRADEERDRVGPAAHGVDVRRHGAQPEQERADREQHADPPVTILRRPPRRAARLGSVQVLPVRAGFPARDHPVGALADDEGNERPEPAFLGGLCLSRYRGSRCAHTSREWVTGARGGITRRE
jgi:hypothetical protein